MKEPNLREAADCLCLASRKAARTITRVFDRELRGQGIRITQFSLLALLHLKGAQSVSSLANELGVERTTLTRNLALLETRRLVAIRAADDDARSRVITLTRQGRDLLMQAFASWQRAQAQVSTAIGSQAAEGLRSLSRQQPR